jgi:hypothetical protein
MRNSTIFQHIQSSHPSIIQMPELSISNALIKLNRQIGQTPDFLPPQVLLYSLTFTHFTELVRVANPLQRLF